MSKNILKHIIRYLLMIAIVVVCCIIFKFSSDASQASSNKSVKASGSIIDILLDGKNMTDEEKTAKINEIEHTVRKLAHFSIYFVLGVLLMLTAQTFKTHNYERFNITFNKFYQIFFKCQDLCKIKQENFTKIWLLFRLY